MYRISTPLFYWNCNSSKPPKSAGERVWGRCWCFTAILHWVGSVDRRHAQGCIPVDGRHLVGPGRGSAGKMSRRTGGPDGPHHCSSGPVGIPIPVAPALFSLPPGTRPYHDPLPVYPHSRIFCANTSFELPSLCPTPTPPPLSHPFSHPSASLTPQCTRIPNRTYRGDRSENGGSRIR